ncbi:MAG TPA: hypothetical protein VJU84_10005 [Pyrinomonadaceae bacterium]|nr:hypothetical protein [Pyrinomonadaceae bacterium]
MNCQSFENVVVDLARLTPLEASVRDAALAHCEACDNCARRLTEEKLLTGGLMALATEMKAAVVAEQVQQNLLSVLRKQRLAAQPERANPGWRYLAVAAAILVAVALGIAGYKMRQTPPVDSQAGSLPATETPPIKDSAGAPTRKQEPTPMVALGIAGYQMGQAAPVDSQAGSVETDTPVPVASTPPVEDSAETPPREQKPTPVVAKKQRLRKFRPDASAHSTFVSVVVGTVTDPEASEVVSHFMPLGDTNPANIQEGAQVVRVELPRYAMARFGLPVNMERYDERVKADVWLGADGLARAIRFVQ